LYVEARVVTDPLDDEPGIQKRRDRVFGIIDAIASPDFWLSVDEETPPASDPPKHLIETLITVWLKTLSWEIERNRMEAGCTDYPERWFDFAGYRVRIEAVARPEHQRNGPGLRTVGATAPGKGAFIQPGKALRKAIKEKASKYGDLLAPFIISLNVMDSSVWSDDDIADALLGDDQIVDVKQSDGTWISETRRIGNGSFMHRKTAQNTRVSAILAFRKLYPWSLSAAEVRLFQNPWTKYPYKGVLSTLPTADDVNGIYVPKQGRSVRNILNL
jgi:hypothetical protein